MSITQWQQGLPEQSGFYWIQETSGEKFIVFVDYTDKDNWQVEVCGSDLYQYADWHHPDSLADLAKAYFYGPLLPPEAPA